MLASGILPSCLAKHCLVSHTIQVCVCVCLSSLALLKVKIFWRFLKVELIIRNVWSWKVVLNLISYTNVLKDMYIYAVGTGLVPAMVNYTFNLPLHHAIVIQLRAFNLLLVWSSDAVVQLLYFWTNYLLPCPVKTSIFHNWILVFDIFPSNSRKFSNSTYIGLIIFVQHLMVNLSKRRQILILFEKFIWPLLDLNSFWSDNYKDLNQSQSETDSNLNNLNYYSVTQIFHTGKKKMNHLFRHPSCISHSNTNKNKNKHPCCTDNSWKKLVQKLSLCSLLWNFIIL